MKPVTRAEIEALAPEWDALVAADSDLDPFCARSAWQLCFHDAFEPDRPLWVARSEGALVVLAESRRASAPGLLEPLENMWGFASPLIGRDAAGLLASALCDEPRSVLLLGLSPHSDRLRDLVRPLAGRFAGRTLDPSVRYVAALTGGVDAWLGRRSPAFRRNLRAARRRSEAAGITFRRVSAAADNEVDDLYAQILELESRSWKGLSGRGADLEPMRGFYGGMLPRLARAGELRVLLAEQAGRLVGYLHGGLVGGHFRGLQFSFDETVRQLGLGNMLQLEMLRWLGELGATTYDLGGQSSYKSRWGEEARSSVSLLLQPRLDPRA